MKAAVMVGFNEPLEIAEVEPPEVADDGVIVRMEACGICRTDWHIWRGHWDWLGVSPTFPLTLGHEMAGVIESVGPGVSQLRVGQRVLAPFHYACGLCDRCQRGLQNLCERPLFPGSSIAGGFGELVSVPHAEVNLMPLPDEIEATEASALGCRFMTAYHGVTEIGQVHPGEWIAVFGCGGVGLSAVMIAAAAGANVIAVDIDDAKLAKAKEVGADVVVNSRSEDVVAAIKEITGGGAAVTVDALGINETVTNAISSLAVRGRHVQIGLTTSAERGLVPLPIDLIVAKELNLMGCHGMPRPNYASLLRMVASGKLRPSLLVGESVELENVNDVLNAMTNFETVGFSVITTW